jgi:hypothetical protein
VRPFQGREVACGWWTFSGGVAPGYVTSALSGRAEFGHLRAEEGAPPFRRVPQQIQVRISMARRIEGVVLLSCMAGISALSLSQAANPSVIRAVDAKNHVGETATVCGEVVDSRIGKYGVGNYGRPVTLDLDSPEPQPVFFFVTWGTNQAKAEQVRNSYQGKQVCVAGKIVKGGTAPYIIASEPSQIKIQTGDKR